MKLLWKILWKAILPVLFLGMIGFFAYININYWNTPIGDIPAWAAHVMFK